MGSGILNVAVSGLNAAQVAIQTASHNIANASTDGYNRQTVVQTTNTPNFTGQGFIGSGTNVSTVKRVYSDFLNNQALSAQTNVSQLQSYSDQISQIDNLLADPNAGLSPGLDGFFSALQQLSSSPSSVPARQAVMSAAQALAGRFNSLDQQLSSLREGVNTQINTEVGSINSLVTQVADLNQRIILAQAAGAGQPANDLIDQRDSVIAQLNKEVRISKQVETDGTYSIFFGNGQPLVAGSQTYTLTAKPSPEDMSQIEVGLKSPSGQNIQLPESLIDGGKLGGLLQFRSQTLDTAQNQLGRVATALVSTFNTQHRLGQDLTGQMGGDFFAPISPQVLGAPTNVGTGVVSATIPTSDYQVDYGAGGYTITRLSDNTSLGTFSQLPQTVEGVQISLATGQPAVGDRFIVSPANDPGKRVAAYGSNTGGATLDSTASNIQSLTDSDYRLSFINGGVTLTRLSDNQVWTASGQNQAANLKTLMANAGPQGFILNISGTAQTGDSFLIRPTRSAARDVKLQ
ncbi:MAG TPA: flagellar hook-associated protein FlgK, partial [Rhodocyclaceae bacterium]